jgi:hypothetical protein
MTGMLASVKNLTEAQLVLNANVDIIDLKLVFSLKAIGFRLFKNYQS